MISSSVPGQVNPFERSTLKERTCSKEQILSFKKSPWWTRSAKKMKIIREILSLKLLCFEIPMHIYNSYYIRLTAYPNIVTNISLLNYTTNSKFTTPFEFSDCGSNRKEKDGWMTYDLTSFSTVFQSNQDDERLIIKGCVHWNPIYG